MTHAKDRVDLLGMLLDVHLRQGEHSQARRIVTELKRSRGSHTVHPPKLRARLRELQRRDGGFDHPGV